MANRLEKGLILHKITSKDNVFIDPDNAFWLIPGANKKDWPIISRRAVSLYEKVCYGLDAQMNDFRFGASLTALYIDPTDKCNANCPYCYIPAKIRKTGKSMTEEELILILEKAAKYFTEQKRKAVIVFHAAEPLLVKDIIFKGIKKFSNEFKFGLQTNATLLKRDDVEFLKEFQVGVGISMDHFSPKVNDRLRACGRGGGNFFAAQRAIGWFNGYEGLNVITTMTKFNIAGLAQMVEFLHSKKVPCALLNPVRLTQKNSRALKPDETLMAGYFIEAVDKAVELSKKTGNRIIIGNFTNVILGIVAPNARRLMCDISPCGGGRCFLTITASGRMIPCGEFIGLKEFSGGNIFKTGIADAMKSASFRKIRERFVEKIEECKTCALRNICGAPCPAELYSMGNMYGKAVFCEFYKKIINHAFKLISAGEEKYCFRKTGLDNLRYEYKLGR